MVNIKVGAQINTCKPQTFIQINIPILCQQQKISTKSEGIKTVVRTNNVTRQRSLFVLLFRTEFEITIKSDLTL